MQTKSTGHSKILAVLACMFLLAALALLALLWFWNQAAQTPPSPNLSSKEQVVLMEESDGFPKVDWNYWLSVNPDIIAWITVPGTDIDNPVVQARSNDPDYYLNHDVYGNYNPYGAIYLDAECEQYGLSSKNAVIMGHHFGTDYIGAPFGILAEYKSKTFASKHATVLIQTPESKAVYEVRFTQIVNGAAAGKRTFFESEENYRGWYEEARNDAVMILDAETKPEQTISLVTCSYSIWVENERTVVTTSRAQ